MIHNRHTQRSEFQAQSVQVQIYSALLLLCGIATCHPPSTLGNVRHLEARAGGRNRVVFGVVIGKFLPLPFNMIFLSIPFTDFYSRASVRTAISAFTIGPLPRQYSTTTIVVQIRQIRPNHNPGLGPGRFDLL